MACTRYINTIQEYVDGTLGSIRRAELELHLEQCDDCRALARDLRRIRDAAASLPPVAPPDGAWLQIAGRLRQEGRVRDIQPAATARRVPAAWLAAAAALLIAVGGSFYFMLSRTRPVTAPPATAATGAASPGNAADQKTVESVQNEVETAQTNYEKAIADMQKLARDNMHALDTKTAATIEKNLAITDQAIAESRAAVKTEPTSVAARETLFDALRQKVALLQDTIALINEMRKGNNAAAVEVLNKTS
jgi:hypothetical protein